MDNNFKKELGGFKSYKDVFNFFPRSVWAINKREKWVKDIFIDNLEKHTYERTSDGIPKNIKQNLSIFNPHLGFEILKMWSNVGDKVIDPFAGRDRPFITNFMDRHYEGYEISKNTFDGIAERIGNGKTNQDFEIQIKNGDGTLMRESKDDSFDFCYTCPPYWFKEKYESCDGQISDIKTREEWISKLEDCAKNLKRVLKKDKYVAIVIADIRNKGELIPLHADFINAFCKQGFSVKDIVINQTNPIQVSGINGFVRSRITMKSHEYILVFKNNK